MNEPSERDEGSTLREAGKGLLWITSAKLWFLLTATFSSLAFPRLFGDPIRYGQYRVVSGILNVVTMVIISGTVQAVSRLASEAGVGPRKVRRVALRVAAWLFVPLGLAGMIGADLLASALLRDPELAAPIRAASGVVIAYAFYAVLVGLINGRRLFVRQAALDMTFSTLKTASMVVVVWVTGSVTGAFGAFAVSAMAVLGLAVILGRLPGDEPSTQEPSSRMLLRYLVPLGGYALVLNLLLQGDVIALKSFLGGRGQDLGGAAWASSVAGVYGAARNVSLLPYQAIISLTFVVFPLISRAASAGRTDEAGRTGAGAMRLASVLSFGAVALLGAAPEPLLVLLFGPDYRGGGETLPWLLGGGAMLAVTSVGNAVLASSGRPMAPLWSALTSLVLLVLVLVLGLPSVRLEAEAFRMAAGAVVLGSLSGLLVTGTLLRGVLGGLPWLRTFGASALGALVGFLVASMGYSWSPVVRSVTSVLGFFGILVGTRGIGREDWHLLRRGLRRKAADAPRTDAGP